MTETKKLEKAKGVAKNIMEFLAGFAEMMPLPFESPYAHVRRMHRQALGMPEPKKWEYRRALKKLEKSRQIIIAEKDGRLFVKLTRKGKLNSLFDKLDSGSPRKAENWDGKWRLILWDIPENSRRQRDAVRQFVKRLGFYQLQKSVFIRPWPLPSPATEYLEKSGLIKFIRMLRIDKIDHDQALKKHFLKNFPPDS